MKRFAAIFTIIVLADQLIKAMVVRYLLPGEGFTVFPSLLAVIHVHNQGAAFGMLPGRGAFFVACALLVTGAAFWLAYRGIYPSLNLAMSLIAGGAVGNLLDRVLSGYVTDYLSLSFFPPVFNLADVAITLGAAILALQLLAQEEKQDE